MKLLALVAASIMSTTAFALDLPLKTANELAMFKAKSELVAVDTDYDFEGIVKLSNCSGSLIIFNGMPTSAKAVVMTNGHCIEKPGYIKPGEAVVNEPKVRSMRIFKTLKKLYPIKSTKILYATMTDSDVAYYELDQTYDQIKAAYDVEPLELSVNRPVVGQPMELISGYWDRGWKCNIDGFVYQIKEKDWTWTDSIRYTSTCDTMGGTSGSPLIARGTRLAIGVNNTSNESGGVCTMNNPCEVDESGNVRAQKGVRYGQQTYPVYTCLTPDFRIDLSLPGCELPR